MSDTSRPSCTIQKNVIIPVLAPGVDITIPVQEGSHDVCLGIVCRAGHIINNIGEEIIHESE